MSPEASPQFDYSIYHLVRYLLSKKWYILGITVGVTFLTALWTLSIANTYKSEIVLSPAEEAVGAGLNGLSGQLGGLASLAGISMGGESTDQVTVALEIVQSRKFIASFVKQFDIKPQLFAGKSWDLSTRTLEIDFDVYDSENKTWKRAPGNGRPSEPTDLEVYEKFLQIFDIQRDTATGLVKASIEYYSPDLAKDWLEKLVAQVNREMRLRELESTTRNISYLEEQITKINDVEMRTIFYQLIQEQTKNLMLAEVRTDFVFSTIDPAFVPELKHAPKRSLICLVAGFLSGFLVVIWFTIVFLTIPRKQ